MDFKPVPFLIGVFVSAIFSKYESDRHCKLMEEQHRRHEEAIRQMFIKYKKIDSPDS